MNYSFKKEINNSFFKNFKKYILNEKRILIKRRKFKGMLKYRVKNKNFNIKSV